MKRLEIEWINPSQHVRTKFCRNYGEQMNVIVLKEWKKKNLWNV
jgi:hypothetical protein